MHQGGGYLNYNGSIDIARTMEELRALRKGDKPEITDILSLRTLRNHRYNIHSIVLDCESTSSKYTNMVNERYLSGTKWALQVD
jgi:hypothetical protein